MKKTELQMVLSRLDDLPDPDPELEQYLTPPDIAADVLNRMQLDGACDGTVLDLGTGNGVLAIGAALLGAEAVGVDRDADALETARANVDIAREEAGTELDATFIERDVRELEREADAVVMNPPFGIRRADANLDFLEAAFDAAPVIYALLHRAKEPGRTRQYLKEFASEHGYETAVLATYRFTIPRRFAFHESERADIGVDLYRFEREDA